MREKNTDSRDLDNFLLFVPCRRITNMQKLIVIVKKVKIEIFERILPKMRS